jgi:predicted Zn finger-like uncharacterized protein
MRIVCPICSATYEVRDDLLVPGRSVRCSRCGEEWSPAPLAPPPAPETASPEIVGEPRVEVARLDVPPPAPRLTAMERLASHPAPLPRPNRGLIAAWVASLLLLILIGAGAVIWRAGVMHVWPPSTRLFDAIGLGPAPPPR